MKMQTKYHGSIEYKEEDVIIFKKGLPGFENLNKFIIFPVEDNPLFSVVHSIEDSEVGFIAISPFDVINDYEVRLEDEVIKDLDVDKPEEIMLLNLVTLNSDISKITVNLKAPIIINIKTKLGEQIILDNEKYIIKHPLIGE